MRNTDTRNDAHTKRTYDWKRERRAANRNKWVALQSHAPGMVVEPRRNKNNSH